MIYRYQQGGAASAQGGDMQQQVVALVQAAMSGDQKAQQQVQQIMEAAKNGDQQAVQVAQMIQQVVQAMQKQARRQQLGGKMDYIHLLRTTVAPDEEVVYEKCGGKMVKKVVKKNGGKSPCHMHVTEGKGETVGNGGADYDKCGGKAAKKGCGGMRAYFTECGGKTKKAAKKCYFGGTL